MDTMTGGTPDAARAEPSPDGRLPAVCSVGPHSGVTDAVGIAVLVCCAGWVLIAAAGRPARPEGALLALLAVTAGHAAGRILGALLPAPASASAAGVLVALALMPPSRLSAVPEAAPPDSPDARAALLVLAVGAACCAAWAARGRVRRTGLRLVGAGAAAAALLLGSVAGCTAGAAVVLCSLAAARLRRRRLLALAALALVAALAVAGSCAVALDLFPARLSSSVTGRLSPPRVELWHRAVALADRHPLRGVGPEDFADAPGAPTTATPATATGSPRSAPLQLAAEQGYPGVALLAVAYGWVLCALWRSSRPTRVVLTAGAALTALALLATVDQVLSHAAVTAGAGYLAGVATARPLAEDGGTGGGAQEPG
ncbi:O-antigen ligase family protein [Streptomyces polygonati]|uniref:O-antigen ligase family protein n=1 Tax=Streptomyces polygonati TaxID=1617087 RepID=A0ABV8HL48_9ACTN